MKKFKQSKISIPTLVITLFLCTLTFVGTTLAWFTDSARSGSTIIKSGTLKVELVDAKGASLEGEMIKWAARDGRAQDEILWEPGCTYKTEEFYIKNAGNLNLKFKFNVTGIDGDAKLLEVIDFSVMADANDMKFNTGAVSVDTSGTFDLLKGYTVDTLFYGKQTFTEYVLEPGDEVGPLVLTGHMDENAGIEYQGLVIDGISVSVVATQATGEEDSFSGTYDENATYPTVVSNAEELAKALATEKNVVLSKDVTVNSTAVIPTGADVSLNLNGKNLSYAVDNSGASAIINNKGNLKIVGEGEISFVAANPDESAIPAYATNTITNTGTLTIGEGVVVKNGSSGGASYAVDNHGIFVLDGGTLIGQRCALRIAKFNQDNVQFIMNSGLVQGATPAWIHLPGSDNKVAPNITVTINGGTFKTTKEPSSADNDVLYTYSFGNSHKNTSITINGGEFLGGTVSIGSGYKGDAPSLIINGGKFEYDILKWLDGDACEILYNANK